jgi:hypothetical protein
MGGGFGFFARFGSGCRFFYFGLFVVRLFARLCWVWMMGLMGLRSFCYGSRVRLYFESLVAIGLYFALFPP